MTTRSRRAAHVVGALCLAVVWYMLLQFVPIAELASALRHADYVSFLAAMVACTVVLFLTDTLVMWTTLGKLDRVIPYRELAAARGASFVAGLFSVNAAHGVFGAYLLRRALTFSELVAVLGIITATEALHHAVWALAGHAAGAAVLPWILTLTAVAIVLLLPAGVAAAALWTRVHPTCPVLRTPALGRQVIALLAAVTRLCDAPMLARLFTYRACAMALTIWLYLPATKAFGVDIPAGALATLLPVIFLLAILPIPGAYLGLTQGAWVALFSPYALPADLLAFSIAAQAAFLATRALIGLLCLPAAFGILRLTLRRRAAGTEITSLRPS